MKVRYTYFAASPYGYGIYDELARVVVAYASDEPHAIEMTLRLNAYTQTAAQRA